ncbi:hypothetical protein Ndes2526B_g09205 [Nannochloris sp. 'desiccata']
MTNDVVAEPSQEQSKDMDQGNRKRSAPKDVEEELTKKRLRENTNAQTASEAAGGEQAHSGQRSEDLEDLDGSVQENAAEQADRPVDNNAGAISEGADVAEATVPAADTACPPAKQQQQEVAPAEDAATAATEPGTAAADATGPSGPPPQPSKQYTDVTEALLNHIEAPPAQIPSPAWTGFSDYLGEGIKTRLLSLATLHLTESGASRCPDAVRQLNANSNRIFLGAALNCELYQERVVRALAHQVGARLLVADSSVLHFDDLPPSSKYSVDDEHAGPGAAMGARGFPDGSGIILQGPGLGGLDGVGGGSGYGTSDDDHHDDDDDDEGGGIEPGPRDTDSEFIRNKAKRFMASDKLKKNTQKVIDQVDAHKNKLEAASKKIEADLEEKSKAANEIKGEIDTEKTESKILEEDGDRAKQGEVKTKEEEKKEKAAEGAGPSSSAPSDPLAAGGETNAKELEYVEGIKAMLQLSKDSQKAYEALLEGCKGTEPTKQAADIFAGRVKPPKEMSQATAAVLEEMKKDYDGEFVPGKICGMAARSSRGRSFGGGRGVGGRGGRKLRGALDPHEMLLEAQRGIDAFRKQQNADDAANKREGASAVFKEGDRVCYAGTATSTPMPSLLSSEERERAAGNSLSAYLSISWLERREATKRKMTAARTAAAAAAAAAETAENAAATAEDGTNPPACSFGRVLSVSGDNTVNIVMDYPFPGGKTFTNQPEKCCFTCPATDLSLVDDRDDAIDASFRALFDTISSQLDSVLNTSTSPLIIFLPNLDRMIKGNDTDTFRRLKERLTTSLPARCLFIGGYCTRSLSKEKSSSGPSGLSMLFGGGAGGGGSRGGGSDSLGVGSGDDIPTPWYERFGGGGSGPGSGRMGRSRGNIKGRAFASMFPNTVELHPPHHDGAAKAWKKMLDQDIAAMREKSNRAALFKALEKCGVVCQDMEAVKVTELALNRKEIEQVVGAAVASALCDEPVAVEEEEKIEEVLEEAEAIGAEDAEKLISEETKNKPVPKKLSISSVHLMAAATSIQHLRAEAAPVPERSALKDLNTDQYERQLLSEVVPPEEIAVGFNDIGALDAVKNTLHEVVILPLQRPELFTRGALTRPTKGLLLFGPPGTGKTMLAKAVASESGAHFININMSAITSKWLGEGERLVRAVFSLAHKLAPSVIFIDEIDSFLAKRGGHSNEHEALRKMKTEFLAGWDGLRTKQTDRVLVLAATNRPMDLDDAAIRRMPRRIFVPLPDANNREKILRTILKDEEVDKELDFVELGKETDGYSGSDLKNLAIAAAYCPLRELLEIEKKRMSETSTDIEGTATTAGAKTVELPPVRSINMADFKSAMKQVTPSTHAESASTSELQKWNEQFGEGGSRRAEPLVYYT